MKSNVSTVLNEHKIFAFSKSVIHFFLFKLPQQSFIIYCPDKGYDALRKLKRHRCEKNRCDLVSLSTAVFMFKVNRKIVPENILCLFENREQKYNLRGENMYKKQKVRTNFKMNTITVKGVDLWNGLTDDLKRSNSIYYLKTV